jgi:hypothetical protein
MNGLYKVFRFLPEWLQDVLIIATFVVLIVSTTGLLVFVLGPFLVPVAIGVWVLGVLACAGHAIWEDHISYKKSVEEQKQRDRAVLERGGRVYPQENGREPFWVDGPPQFVAAVDHLLTQLRERTPHRYEEVITYLPKAVYDPSILSIPAHGLADGRFAMDGTEPYFRFIFLHEVGHTVHGKQFGDWSEDAATAYAHTVIHEANL